MFCDLVTRSSSDEHMLVVYLLGTVVLVLGEGAGEKSGGLEKEEKKAEFDILKL